MNRDQCWRVLEGKIKVLLGFCCSDHHSKLLEHDLSH